MARVALIRTPEDFPYEPDDSEREAIETFFAKFTSYREEGYRSMGGDEADPSRAPSLGRQPGADPSAPMANWAALVNSPELANKLVESGGYVVNRTAWSKRTKMRELMYLALAAHLRYHSLFAVHYDLALEAGVTPEQVAYLPFDDVSDVFNEEERVVIAYTRAVLDSNVSDALFERGRAIYGDKEMVEMTVAISYSAFKIRIYRALQAFEWPESEAVLPRGRPT